MAYDDITFDMTEDIETLNEKKPGGGGYAIPREYVIQKYLKERINPTMPTATILAALDQRKWEQKQAAEAQGPQQSVFEETISETETAMPQGITQGQPQQRPPMPGQMPTQMAGLQRPPMPGRVPPQRNDGIPMMAARGGYVPNFADGGIIGYRNGKLVKNRFDPDARPFTERSTSFMDIIGDVLSTEGGYSGPLSYEQKAIEEIRAKEGIRGKEFPTILGSDAEKLAREAIFDEIKQREQIRIDTEGGGGWNPQIDSQTQINRDILEQTDENKKIALEKEREQREYDALWNKQDNKGEFIDPKFIDPQKGLRTEGDEGEYSEKELQRADEDFIIFEPEDSILAGDDAVKAYEDRIGVSPFVALAGEYEQEIGENIAEAKKQSIGKMLYNFGSELTKSGKLGNAAVAAGRDIDKDMDRLIELKREQRKVGFDIAKIAEAERQTKGKIGLTAEQQAKKDNLTKGLKKREFEIIEEKNRLTGIYQGKMGDAALIRAGTEAAYYKGQDSLGKMEDRIHKRSITTTFGKEGGGAYIRFRQQQGIYDMVAKQPENLGKSMQEIIDIAFERDEAGGKEFLEKYNLLKKNEALIRRIYQDESNSISGKKPPFAGGGMGQFKKGSHTSTPI